MLEWLGEWLREIIMMILIATFIDLVLPNGSTQRYVRVVISLFILLALLSPVVNVLRVNIDPARLLADAPEAAGGEAELERIMRDGERLRAGMDQEALALFRRQAGQLLKEQLEAEFPVRLTEVDIVLAEGEAAIAGVRLTAVAEPAASEGGAEATRREQGMAPIEPIRPVNVDIRVGRDSPPDPTGRGEPSLDEAHQALVRSMTRWLESEWKLPASGIRMTIAEDQR